MIGTAVAADIPARPEFGVLDQASLFPLPLLKVTERLISEHQRLTLEQISILTLTGVPGGKLPEIATAVLAEWRKTAPQPPSSLLIVVDGKRGNVEIRTGLGLDPVLPAGKVGNLRKTFFKPEWRAGHHSRAIVLLFSEVLRSIGSPLIAGDEVTSAYEHAGFTGGWVPAAPQRKPWTPWIFTGLGLAAAAFVLVRILIGEVHYTAAGWYPVPASTSLRWYFRRLFHRHRDAPALVTGGGISGKY
jgi:uncharacterized membrane protein YgcG